ncbi:MAG TPA: alpha/beta fold hydrolase, partial [Anaerolineales bacterium]|nr:alpha/beta fold hydrolase [Anaerolineales bacterium]
VMSQNLWENREQRRRSWYLFFFQLPLLPELVLRLNKHRGAVRLLKSSGKEATLSKEDLAHYREAWSQPRAWTGMINWYRALRLQTRRRLPRVRVDPPTLIIWGEQDVALGATMAEESLALCKDGRLERVPDATHWVQHDAAEQVNAWLVDFFTHPD